ncbi:hypothetical protein [Bradyrhizobium japonicum]|uniref:hypothetical protein n=1 Tax=Bradyrhizobium japonicum TaxID=375 RepID=UPI0004BBB2C8|nr:hypothetical protein [Bradyrhizobium japonicum]MCP1774890.1 hypothetical protein [Bradyrhizobium japonicum]MCP1962110.1 hypothetical protein [Bradyrhizobium japonicum]
MFACNLTSGEGHAFLLLDDGRVLDNRFDQAGEVGCRAYWLAAACPPVTALTTMSNRG